MARHKKARVGGPGSGSGRTTGSFSFVKVTLGQLKAKFNDDDQPIIVKRIWAEECGFKNLTSAPANRIADQISGSTPESAVDIKISEVE